MLKQSSTRMSPMSADSPPPERRCGKGVERARAEDGAAIKRGPGDGDLPFGHMVFGPTDAWI
jgi:hypothetical protein